jgi:hypothetical protein
MKEMIQMNDLPSFPDQSRIWIYQATTTADPDSVGKINQAIVDFTREWTSHNLQLRATGGLLHGRFVVLIVDESQAGTSGCSIDKSVYFIKHLEEKYNLDLLNRLYFAYLDQGEVKVVHKGKLTEFYQEGRISEETLFFDNLVKTKGEFVDRWIVPLKKSWIKRML